MYVERGLIVVGQQEQRCQQLLLLSLSLVAGTTAYKASRGLHSETMSILLGGLSQYPVCTSIQDMRRQNGFLAQRISQ